MRMNHYSKISASCLAAVSLMAMVGSARAQVPYPTPGIPVTTPEELFASGGDVTVTFLGRGGASYTDLLFLSSPTPNAFSTPSSPIFNNQTTPGGTTVDLGTFAAGTELVFGVNVVNTGNTWYTGPAARNSDDTVHAYLSNDYNGDPTTTYVGFEDLAANVADFNYTDVQYTFTGVAAADATTPDVSTTLPLLGMSLAGLLAVGRRLRK